MKSRAAAFTSSLFAQGGRRRWHEALVGWLTRRRGMAPAPPGGLGEPNHQGARPMHLFEHHKNQLLLDFFFIDIAYRPYLIVTQFSGQFCSKVMHYFGEDTGTNFGE